MKKSTVFRNSIALFFAALAIVACSDDNNDTPSNESIAGTYQGWSKVTFPDMPTGMGLDGEAVQISNNSDGTVKVAYTSKGAWGTSIFNSATVTTANGKYHLVGLGKSTIEGRKGGKATEYDCALTGEISKDKKIFNLIFTLKDVMGGTKISFAQGRAPLTLLVANSYKGYTTASSKFFQNKIDKDQTVTVAASEDAKSVTVNFKSNTWGTASLTGVTVSASGEQYILDGKGTIKMGMGGQTPKDYECIFQGKISKDGKTYGLSFTMPAVMGGTTVTLKNGTAPKTKAAEDLAAKKAIADFFAGK